MTFLGWLPAPGPPFPGPVLIPYRERLIVLIGPNGYGKTRLLQAIVDRRTPRLFATLPGRLSPYLTMERAAIESGRRTARGDRELFETAESVRPREDDRGWWCARLGRPELWWSVAPDALHAVAPEDPFTPLVTIPAAHRHTGLAVEPWVRPGDLQPTALDAETTRVFRDWAHAALATGSARATVPANPLVARSDALGSISLLALAEAFCDLLAERAAQRLRVLAGFAVELRCLAVENFAWQVSADGHWIPLVSASRALSRWCTLSATETLRELQQSVAEAELTQIKTDSARTLAGDLDRALLPPGEPGAFATRTTWVAMDEPEVNLFAPAAHHLAGTLAARAGVGRTLIATHSLDLAARFVGIADFLLFDGPGRYSLERPERGIVDLLGRLTAYGPGALAATRVLHVEGDWDFEILERLHGPRLAAANVVMSRMHGVRGAGIAASSVWQRMTSTSFGMMFDHVSAAEAGRRWARVRETLATRGRAAAIRELRAGIGAGRGRAEDVEMLRMFASVLDGGIEDRLHLVMHGLSDIFQVMHPSVFGLTAGTWADAGYDGRTGFKVFCRSATGVDLGAGAECRRLVKAFDAADRPVEPIAAAALDRAVTSFIEPG